jgi:hypothetical protein
MLDETKYGHAMTKRARELAIKLCTENDLVILKKVER